MRGSIPVPSANAASLERVWEAHLICSGRDCYAEIEVAIGSLEELEGLSCGCGHGFVLLAVSELSFV